MTDIAAVVARPDLLQVRAEVIRHERERAKLISLRMKGRVNP
jgi:hypothetical protein